MALLALARRLQKPPPQFLFLLASRSITPSTPLNVISFLSQSIRRTPLPHVSAQPARFFSLHSLRDPAVYIQQKIQSSKPRDATFLKLLDKLESVADFSSEEEAIAFLNDSGINPTCDLVHSVTWELKDRWKMAFFVFRWGQKWGCGDEKAFNLMVFVLGNQKKFNTAWCLIRDMCRLKFDARQAMLVMIDRYAAANKPGESIRTFNIMEKFRLTPDLEAFYSLLSILCNHGNIEEAEEFMLVNKKLFPLETEGFNIILNGWCNISVDVYEAKRIWREMSNYCITANATSYTHMISCFSKVGNLFDSLRLYDEMKKRGWIPGIEVYNSLVYILTDENCLNEARKILDNMRELGLQPNSATYNSIIYPLCKANKINEAKDLLREMIDANISPTTETYHAFLEAVDFEVTLEVLKTMKNMGIDPSGDTFLLLFKKFFKLEQLDYALKIWEEMKRYEVVPDNRHYLTLIEGLAHHEMLIRAWEFYAEMKSNGWPDDPKLKILLEGKVHGNRRREGAKQVSKHKQANIRRGRKRGSTKRQRPSGL